MINNGKSLLLTNPWHNKAFGKWLPSPPSFFHPSYLASLAQENKDKFSILISNITEDSFDQKYLELFPKNVNLIVPRRESPWLKICLQNLGFVNINEINHRTEVNDNKIKIHPDGIITIETLDAFIIFSGEKYSFTEQVIHSVDKHLQDYKQRSIHYGNSGDKIILAAPINVSQEDYPNIYSEYLDEESYEQILSKRVNELYISSINIGAKYLFYFGGHANFCTEKSNLAGYKTSNFYSKFIKEHLINKIRFINLIPGYTFDFEKLYGAFGDFNYSEETLKKNSLDFYQKNTK